MNRPSRTDDDFDHPTWNQNPPFLAADLTTCQDLNGIANSRELKKIGGSAGAAFGMEGKAGLLLNSAADEDGAEPLGAHLPAKMSAGTLLKHLCRPAEAGAGSTVLGWALWIVSVLVTSFVLSSLSSHRASNSTSTSASASTATVTTASRLSAPVRIVSKRDACESGGVRGEYNTPLHVGALLIILFVSSTACAFPMLAKKFPKLRIPENFFFAIRHFGTGVLIATAFVHLLPTAFISLGDPCLSGFWTSDYPAMPGAIALAGIFFVAIIEMVFNPARYFPHCAPPPSIIRSSAAVDLAGNRSRQQETDDIQTDGAAVAQMEIGTVHGRRDSISRQLSRLGGVEDVDASNLPKEEERSGKRTASPANGDVELVSGDHHLSPEQQLKKQILQCMLLEVGILFHSVFIGMALSVAIGTDFIVLLIAVSFHQTFEGLALGARIAAIDWPRDSYRPWLMDLAYGLTTPIGQALGLATHTLYNPNSSFGLVLVGTMNAISSGLLVYASLVELMSEDFLSDESWRILRGKKRVAACLIVFAGAFCMSLVGAWA